MTSVTVGGLNNNIVRLINIGRVFNYRLLCIAYIARKHKLSGFTVLSYPHLYACRTEKMPGIVKAYLYAVRYFNNPAVRTGLEKRYRTDCVVHGIKRNIRLCSGTLCLTASPLGFKLLNMRGITKHNIAQKMRRLS